MTYVAILWDNPTYLNTVVNYSIIWNSDNIAWVHNVRNILLLRESKIFFRFLTIASYTLKLWPHDMQYNVYLDLMNILWTWPVTLYKRGDNKILYWYRNRINWFHWFYFQIADTYISMLCQGMETEIRINEAKTKLRNIFFFPIHLIYTSPHPPPPTPSFEH